MTAFEEGYSAFLAGRTKDQNPYDKEDKSCPYSMKRWQDGWLACARSRKNQ